MRALASEFAATRENPCRATTASYARVLAGMVYFWRQERARPTWARWPPAALQCYPRTIPPHPAIPLITGGKGGKGGKVGGKGGKAPTSKKAPQSRSSRAGLQV